MTASLATLNDACEFIVDCLHATAPTQEKGYPLIRTPNIGKGRLKLDGVYRVSEDTYDEWTRRAVPKAGDLILAREAPAGNVAIVKEGQQVCLGQRTVHLRPDNSYVDPDFLCYYLLAPPQQGALFAGETGATAKHVNMKDIRRLPLKGLPHLTLQQKIGGILSVYDDLIENNRRRIHLLKQAARLLYKEWFVHLRFPGHEHTKIQTGIPEGWEKKQIKDVIGKVARPKKIQKADYLESGDIPCVDQSREFIGGYTDDEEATINIGKPVVVFGDHTRILKYISFPFACGADGTQLIVSKDEMMSQEYLFFALDAIDLSNYFYARHFKFLKDQYILRPSTMLLSQFTDVARPIMVQIDTLRSNTERLAKARDLLLPRLMNGEVAV